MGHQVNYYQMPSDVAVMEQRLRTRLKFVILDWRSPSESPRMVESLVSEENGRRLLSFFLIRPEDLRSVVMWHVSNQGYWTVDDAPSPVVEVSSCFFDGTILRRGRVYYTDGLYGPDGQWVLKSEEFRKWAKLVLATIKKSLKPLEPGKRFTDYIGEDAAKWHAAGGKLVQM